MLRNKHVLLPMHVAMLKQAIPACSMFARLAAVAKRRSVNIGFRSFAEWIVSSSRAFAKVSKFWAGATISATPSGIIVSFDFGRK